jgi:hypothetical protein
MSAPTIRILAPGEQITEAGFYNISLDVHHGQPCDGPSVTSGILRTIEHGTPADVWAFHKLNPNRWEKPETDALRLGRAMAAWIEGGMDAVAKEYLVLPEDKPNRPTDAMLESYRSNGSGDLSMFAILPEKRPRRPSQAQIEAVQNGVGSDTAVEAVRFWHAIDQDPRTYVTQAEFDAIITQKGRIEFWANVEADGRTPLSDAEITMIRNMGRAFDEDPAAAAIMGGLPEITMAWRDPETGLWLLARPDTVNFDGTVTDYKKVAAQGRPFTAGLIDRRITQHGYHMQLAFAGEGMEALGIGWPQLAAIVAQSDAPPHHIIPRVINEEALRFGQFQNRAALRTFATCLDTGHWPGPGELIGEYQMPEFEKQRIADRMTWKPEGDAE